MKRIYMTILLILALFVFAGCSNDNLLTLDNLTLLHEEDVEDLIQPLSYNVMFEDELNTTQIIETSSENTFLSDKGACEWLLISMDNEGQYTFDGLTLTKNIYNDDHIIQSTNTYDLDDSYCSDYGEGLCLSGGGRRLFTTAGMNSIYVPILTPDGITGQIEYIVDSVRYTDKNGKFVNAIKEGSDTVLMYITKDLPVLNNYSIDSNYKITLNITAEDDLEMYAINVNNQLVEPDEYGDYYVPEDLRDLELYYIEVLYEMYPNSNLEGASNLVFSQEELEVSTLAEWDAIPNEFNGIIILMNDLDISLSTRESFTNSFILNGNYYILSCDHEVTFATGQVFKLKNVILDFSAVIEPTELEFIAETEMSLDRVYMLYYGNLTITTLDEAVNGSYILTTATMTHTNFNIESELIFAYSDIITYINIILGTDSYTNYTFDAQYVDHVNMIQIQNNVFNEDGDYCLNNYIDDITSINLAIFFNQYFEYYIGIDNLIDSYNEVAVHINTMTEPWLEIYYENEIID